MLAFLSRKKEAMLCALKEKKMIDVYHVDWRRFYVLLAPRGLNISQTRKATHGTRQAELYCIQIPW